MVYESHSAQQTENIGAEFACALPRGSVVAFRGGLGAGKTAFIRGMVRGLGIDEYVTSPTFTIVNEYLGPVPVFHFDMYRLSGEDELFDIGWEDYLCRGGICCVEWSENVPDAFDDNTIWVEIEKVSDDSRRIIITFPEGKK
jgi:tRNA threonylcarbamoyladenosine biosynthesis protein TsaE